MPKILADTVRELGFKSVEEFLSLKMIEELEKKILTFQAEVNELEKKILLLHVKTNFVEKTFEFRRRLPAINHNRNWFTCFEFLLCDIF